MALPQEEVLHHYKKLLFHTYCQTWEVALEICSSERQVQLKLRWDPSTYQDRKAKGD